MRHSGQLQAPTHSIWAAWALGCPPPRRSTHQLGCMDGPRGMQGSCRASSTAAISTHFAEWASSAPPGPQSRQQVGSIGSSPRQLGCMEGLRGVRGSCKPSLSPQLGTCRPLGLPVRGLKGARLSPASGGCAPPGPPASRSFCPSSAPLSPASACWIRKSSHWSASPSPGAWDLVRLKAPTVPLMREKGARATDLSTPGRAMEACSFCCSSSVASTGRVSHMGFTSTCCKRGRGQSCEVCERVSQAQAGSGTLGS